MDPGMYEIRLSSYEWVTYTYNDEPGSFFNVTASQLSMSIDDIDVSRNETESSITLENVRNHGMGFKAKAQVISDKVRKEDSITVKHEEKTTVPIEVTSDTTALEISTKYIGSLEEMDLDIQLLDSTGKMVAQSGTPTSDELIKIDVTPGSYSLVAFGFKIPGDVASFNLTISRKLKDIQILSQTFKSSTTKEDFSDKFFQEYSYHDTVTTSFKIPTVPEQFLTDGYSPITTVQVFGKYGTEQILLYNKDIK
jgi:hypothetical protein